MRLTGAQIIIRKLLQHKVKIIFEFPGGSICPILDELYRQKRIKAIITKHEQAAIHAADAYARVSGTCSVCMATSGPGASNLVTGIANAYMDSVPVVIITGQVAVWDLKKHKAVRQRGFQELDIVSVVKSITKAAFLVNHVSDLAQVIDKAFFIAKSGRPGPVLIDLPINVQYTSTEFKDRELNLIEKKPARPDKAIEEIVKKLIAAKRPLVIAGGGVVLAKAEDKLKKLLVNYRLPAVETLMGLTSVSADYRLNLGLAGYAGSRAAHNAVKAADFILALGLRFDNRAFPEAKKEFSKSVFIAHVDCDRAELNHRVVVNKAVYYDVGEFLQLFIQKLKKNSYSPKREWISQIVRWKEEADVCPASNKNRITPRFILDSLSSLLRNQKAVITTDVGQHQLWTAQYFKFNHHHALVTSGGLGTMGFGLPAAIGARLAKAKASVFNITSDGSFQMNIQELATIKENKLPIKIILLNNQCLGLVRQIQEFAFCKRYHSTLQNSAVDFVKIASSYGIESFRVTKPQGVIPMLKKLSSSNNSMFVEFVIDRDENVYPVRIMGKVIYNYAKS